MEEIKIELLEGGILPTKEFDESAGYDLYVPKRTFVASGKTVVPLGFKMALPKGKAALIFSRSGVEAKGVPGWLSESNGQLCNVKVKNDILEESKYMEMCKDGDMYYVDRSKKINCPDGKVLYDATYRCKVHHPTRLDKCSVKLSMVDCGARGGVGMILDNMDVPFYIEAGQSIAQMVIIDIPSTKLKQVDKLDDGEGKRGEQGFNS